MAPLPDDPRGILMLPNGKLLFRQISPGKVKADGPGRSNFIPEDGIGLSTRREDMGAKEAFDAHIALCGPGKSLGTWGVTVAEADNLGLPAYDDEHLPDTPPFHVSIHFPPGGRRAHEKLALGLHGHAKRRGWLYQPPTASGGTITVGMITTT
ncbi:hypothetical protein IU421_14815 [Nocardia cyriacigeorgica]|uniref:hypothetical protein n=1 Tax=Nocardia cyriacigeorgica TaxID=135487 RepID=UPI00189307F3|nr:hypothetical protein [Nocardia cyriacigeorgica]MBF6515542.1 hypothetical protein [Nocardia cyriacigeorgica]